MVAATANRSEGSVGWGFVLGLFLGLIGPAVAVLGVKAPLTTKGTIYGVVTRITIAVVVGFVVGLTTTLSVLR